MPVVFLCTVAGQPAQRVLVRQFGKGSDLVINRPRELEVRTDDDAQYFPRLGLTPVQVFTYLSDHGFSPKLLASFEGGRLEQFIESTTLYGKGTRQTGLRLPVSGCIDRLL
jgi:hypothetical protein